MPIPRIVRQWNKAGLNRVTSHIAPRAPGMGVIIHRGRRSGRLYQTPVNVFSAQDGSVFALTHGPDTDRVKNVPAAGGCEPRTRGHATQLTSPRPYHDQSRRDIRPAERQVPRLLGVADFLFLKTLPPAATTAGQSRASGSDDALRHPPASAPMIAHDPDPPYLHRPVNTTGDLWACAVVAAISGDG